MDDRHREFRETMIGILEFISSEQQQVDFASKVFYKNYPEEFFEWWPEQWDPADKLIGEAFTKREMGLLQSFCNLWQSLEPEFCHDMPIHELLSNSAWKQVMTNAKSVLSDVSNAT